MDICIIHDAIILASHVSSILDQCNYDPGIIFEILSKKNNYNKVDWQNNIEILISKFPEVFCLKKSCYCCKLRQTLWPTMIYQPYCSSSCKHLCNQLKIISPIKTNIIDIERILLFYKFAQKYLIFTECEYAKLKKQEKEITSIIFNTPKSPLVLYYNNTLMPLIKKNEEFLNYVTKNYNDIYKIVQQYGYNFTKSDLNSVKNAVAN